MRGLTMTRDTERTAQRALVEARAVGLGDTDHGARLRAAVTALDRVCTACTTREERVEVRTLRRAADQVLNPYVEDGLREAADDRTLEALARHVHAGCTEFYGEGVTP